VEELVRRVLSMGEQTDGPALGPTTTRRP